MESDLCTHDGEADVNLGGKTRETPAMLTQDLATSMEEIKSDHPYILRANSANLIETGSHRAHVSQSQMSMSTITRWE